MLTLKKREEGSRERQRARVTVDERQRERAESETPSPTFYFERILKATDVDNIKNYVETHIMLKSYYFQKQILALSSESN